MEEVGRFEGGAMFYFTRTESDKRSLQYRCRKRWQLEPCVESYN